ncbi:MAG TPA: SAF domain-containing protein [Acidimicrobiales bacterium]
MLWWLAVVGLSLSVGLVLESGLSRAQADARRFGAPVRVVVARVDLAAGAVAGPETVDLRPWPAALVPAGALDTVPDGQVVSQAILAGEPVVEARLGAEGLVPPRSRALALPTGPGALGVRVGDRVDLLATFDPLVAPAGEDPTVTVARAATVVAVRARSITVAVSEAETPRVAFALSQATITLALTPPDTFAPDDGESGSTGP